MEMPRDPMGQLLAGLSLLNDGQQISVRYRPAAGEGVRWVVAFGGEDAPPGPTATGDSFLEAVTSAYRGSVADLEVAVRRQVNAALERA